MSLIPLLAAAMLSAKVPVAASQWVPVTASGAAGNQQAYFVNRSTLERRGQQVEIEMTMIRELPNGGVDRVLERSMVNCADRSSRMIDVSFLNRADHVVASMAGDGESEHYSPGSAGQIVLDTVCEDSWSARETDDPRGFARLLFRQDEVTLSQR